jgi:hypothetical protein
LPADEPRRGQRRRATPRAFCWPHGPLEVIAQTALLGLVDNVFFCGAALSSTARSCCWKTTSLSRFHAYARQALAVYGDDDRPLLSPTRRGSTVSPTSRSSAAR